MRIPMLLVLLCCAVLPSLATENASAATTATTDHSATVISVDPLYQPVPISSAMRMVVFCTCQTSSCPQHGPGGQLCGGDPEIFCPTCHCIVAPDGSRICAKDQ